MTEVRAPAGHGDARPEGGVTAALPSTPHSLEVTPSGIEIAYFVEDKAAKVKRHYEIRGQRGVHYGGYEYAEWREVPSVSTITDIVKDAGPLIWWGQSVGVQAVLDLLDAGHLRPAKLLDGQIVLSCPSILPDGSQGLARATPEAIVDLMTEQRITTNHVTRSAGDRGTNVHTALELWAEKGELPDPSFFPPEEAGYVAGLRMFLEAIAEGEPELVASERMVASLEHGFAGRFDLELRTHKPCQIVKRWTPKRGPQYMTLEPGHRVWDLKTSSGIFESHCIQLEGYEIGRIESGWAPSDERMVIHVHPGDPKKKSQPDSPYYEVVKSWARPESFLAVLQTYKELEAMKERK